MDIISTFLFLFALLQPTDGCLRAEYRSGLGECCPMCGRGLVVRKDCTQDSSTSCIPCLKGTYMDEPNGYNKCRQCKRCDSGQGLYTLRECTTTENAMCDVLDGHYCLSFSSPNECSFAGKHTLCTAGQKVKTPGSKTSDTECEDCPKSQYSTDGVNCIAWTDCDAIGKQKVEEGSATADVKCTDIPRQRFGLILSVGLSFIMGALVFYGRFQKKNFHSGPDSLREQESSKERELQTPIQESTPSKDSDGVDSGFDGASNTHTLNTHLEECKNPQGLRKELVLIHPPAV